MSNKITNLKKKVIKSIKSAVVVVFFIYLYFIIHLSIDSGWKNAFKLGFFVYIIVIMFPFLFLFSVLNSFIIPYLKLKKGLSVLMIGALYFIFFSVILLIFLIATNSFDTFFFLFIFFIQSILNVVQFGSVSKG
jgi:hypothetical protein